MFAALLRTSEECMMKFMFYSFYIRTREQGSIPPSDIQGPTAHFVLANIQYSTQLFMSHTCNCLPHHIYDLQQCEAQLHQNGS